MESTNSEDLTTGNRRVVVDLGRGLTDIWQESSVDRGFTPTFGSQLTHRRASSRAQRSACNSCVSEGVGS